MPQVREIVTSGADDVLARRRLTPGRAVLLRALAAMQGPAQLDALPLGEVGSATRTVRLLHEMRKQGLVSLVERHSPRGRAGATHNTSIDRIQITTLGRAVLGVTEADVPKADDDTRDVAQDDAPTAPTAIPAVEVQHDHRRREPGQRLNGTAAYQPGRHGLDRLPRAAPGGPVERVRPDVLASRYPVLAELRDRQVRHQRMAALLRQAADLATDTALGVRLLEDASAETPYSDWEREYLRYASAHPDDDGGDS